MIKAQCVKDCTWKGRYWERGAVYEGHTQPPSHFKVLADGEQPAKPNDIPEPEVKRSTKREQMKSAVTEEPKQEAKQETKQEKKE